MVKSNRYTPTNKSFRNKFQEFASTKAKKGHLNQQKEDEKTSTQTGTLIKIDRKKLYSNGWLVETTDGKQYWCSYSDGVLCIPESTVSESYYVPKKRTEVEVSIDTEHNIYLITRLKDTNKKPVALYNDTLELSINTNTDTNKNDKAKIEVSKTDIKMIGQTIADSFQADSINITKVTETETLKAKSITSDGTIKSDTIHTEQLILGDDEEDLGTRLSKLEEKIKELEQTESEDGD